MNGIYYQVMQWGPAPDGTFSNPIFLSLLALILVGAWLFWRKK